jgi:hypothetical protein
MELFPILLKIFSLLVLLLRTTFEIEESKMCLVERLLVARVGNLRGNRIYRYDCIQRELDRPRSGRRRVLGQQNILYLAVAKDVMNVKAYTAV